MSRVLWKGAITLGLVNIPVNLYPGSASSTLDLDLLDKRDFAPVGYRRVNKRTGEEVSRKDLVKGYEHAKGQYVVVTDEDFKQANVKATQTVDIKAFVEAVQIAPYYYDSPYYLEPGKRGEKGYALLRETLRRTARVALATVVLRSRQHLAAVIPVGELLLLNTLRFADEIRAADGLDLPSDNLKKIGVSAKEIEMATRLVEDMSAAFTPEDYKDTYRDDLLARLEQRAKKGQAHEVPTGRGGAKGGAKVIDLMAALRRSREKKSGDGAAGAPKPPRRASSKGARARASSGERSRKRA